MAFKGAKHRTVTQATINYDGGLNLKDAPTALQDNQLVSATNFYYKFGENVLSTRPGLKFVCSAPTSGLQITKLYYYVRSSSISYLVASFSDGNLYYLNNPDQNTYNWVLIGPLSNNNTIPSFCTFNAKLIIADGGSTLRSWDGSPSSSSNTSLSLSAAQISLTVGTGLNWTQNTKICIQKDVSNYMTGSIASYNQSTGALTVNVSVVVGGGTYSNWLVTTYQPILNSPPASVVIEMNGRLFCNSSTDNDGVYFSGAQDETNWNIQNGSGFVRCGYGDNLQVIGFGFFNTDLIVFKGGVAGKRIYRIYVTGATSAWYVKNLSKNSTAVSHHAIEYQMNKLIYGSVSGIMDLSGTIQFGDLEQGVVGENINSALNGKLVKEIRAIPAWGTMFVLIDGDYRIFIYHPWNGKWTDFDFQEMFPTSIIQANLDVFISFQNGSLYLINSNATNDETTSGVFEDYSSVAQTKTFIFDGKTIIRKSRLFFDVLSTGNGSLEVIGSDQITATTLATWVPEKGMGLLCEWTNKLCDSSAKIAVQSSGYLISRARYRDQALSFRIKTSSGRIKIKQLAVELAAVNG